MKTIHIIAILVILVTASLAISQSVMAQQSQTSYTANLTYLTVQLSYPSQVLPGDSVTANLQASAKSSISSVSLTAQIFYTSGTDLHQLASVTVSSSSYMTTGNTMTKQIQFTVPQDAPRTSLVAQLTEKVQSADMSNYYGYGNPYYYGYGYGYPYYYYYYPTYTNYSSPTCYTDPYWGYECYYNYTYYASYYPSYSSTTTTDSAIAPFSYIKATTPEYSAALSQNQALQQQLNQTKAQNQQLNQNLQNDQATISQKDATITSLNQQINSAQGMSSTLETVAVVLGIIAIACAGIAAREHGRSQQPKTNPATTSTQPQPKP